MPRIEKVLIANRGEIAVRIMQTCQDMGIATVAVCSEADLGALHVGLADEAVLIGPAPAAESYLRIDRLVEAAQKTGADAIHPGYGFLSENAAFARACSEAGITFVGPSADTIEAFGSKARARVLVQEKGIPVVPGYNGADQSNEALAAGAIEIGFPVLIKASAGGGGKGMRIVRESEGLNAALDSARREATSAFGDSTLLIERYIESPRHIEVQIFGDSFGQIMHLFERECSIQRRHQKIIEETPSPAIDDDLREDLTEAAVEIGEAIGYVGAGTVEFIVDPDGRFYFLEVNTRLQVEHPITESVVGLDLVRLQLEVAMGHPLGLNPDLIDAIGHAIECRIYAEDADAGFLPSTGTVLDWHLPEVPWLRVDSGVDLGSEISIHYDPMLAKVITSGNDREEALRRMVWALRGMSALGVTTNIPFLIDVLNHADFQEGDYDTHFIDERMQAEEADDSNAENLVEALAVLTLTEHAMRRATDMVLPEMRSGFRNVSFRDQQVQWQVGDAQHSVSYRDAGALSYRMSMDGWLGQVRLLAVDGAGANGGWDGPVSVRLVVNGHIVSWRVARTGETFFASRGGQYVAASLVPRFPQVVGSGSVGGAVAPMPGTILGVSVEEGDTVEAGQALAILEAMKMEHTLVAERAGVVTAVSVSVGDVVEAGAVLVVVEAGEVE